MKYKVKQETLFKRAKLASVTQIVMKVCGKPHEEAFQIAKNACVFDVPKRYAGGKKVARGY